MFPPQHVLLIKCNLLLVPLSSNASFPKFEIPVISIIINFDKGGMSAQNFVFKLSLLKLTDRGEALTDVFQKPISNEKMRQSFEMKTQDLEQRFDINNIIIVTSSSNRESSLISSS